MNSDCESYASHNSYQFSIYQYLISRIVPHIKEHDNILDVGSGDGKCTNLLYETLLNAHDNIEFKVNVLGIDLLSRMIEYARERYCSHQKSLEFSNIDITSKNAPENILNASKGGVIDHVVSSCCFHWVGDQLKAFANLLKVINWDGGSINIILNCRIVGSLNYATERTLDNQELSPHLKKLKKFYDGLLLPWRRAWMIEHDPILAYKKIMIEAGYKEDKITIEEIDEINYSFQPSIEAAANFVQGFFPDVLADIDKSGLKEQFFKMFMKNVLEYNEKHYGDKLKMCFPLMYVHYSL
ncbi:unnamed protein product [Gordionus sp. m RMFG-2023]|uniref:juvenile hormone acid O-methyltransferase-like n=1 Tax=Gordionus sp. m RMFG-2023 TaxID=3053472 RepID=UPI0030E3162C